MPRIVTRLFLMLALMVSVPAQADAIKVIAGKCTDTIIYPPPVVSLLMECYKTDQYEQCMGYGDTPSPYCPAVCQKAMKATKPYVKKGNDLYLHNRDTAGQSGWIYQFSKKQEFGVIIGYATKTCTQSPPKPSCTLPICDGMLWNIM